MGSLLSRTHGGNPGRQMVSLAVKFTHPDGLTLTPDGGTLLLPWYSPLIDIKTLIVR